MFISFDLMLLLNMIESPVNILSGNHFGERQVCVELRKIACPVAFGNGSMFSCEVF
jgi:hypothetical protein